jgi:signal peptide peptidase SppA
MTKNLTEQPELASAHYNIAARVLNTPLLLEPGYAKVFLGALAPRIGVAQLLDEHGVIESQEKLRMRADSFETQRDCNRPYQVIDGIAVLPVSGSLVHKYGHLKPYSGLTGYDGLVARIEDAVADGEIEGILLDIDSPGGEVSGCFDCARRIAQLRGTKPIAALCYDMACSAAMAIASAADRRYITSTGRTGSIGVVMMHASMEKRLSKEGYEVTLIHSGALKAAGNPYQALPSEVLEMFQAEADSLRQDFVQLVSDHTQLSVEAILETEAAVFTGQSAIDIGLADELVNGHDAVNVFKEYIKTTSKGALSMSVATQNLKAKAKAADEEEKETKKAQDEQEKSKEEAAEEEEETKAASEEEANEDEDDEEMSVAAAAEIASMCASVGVGSMASRLIKECSTLGEAKKRIEDAKQIRDMCATAKLPDRADGYLAAGLTSDEVRARLFDAMALSDSETHTNNQPPQNTQAQGSNWDMVFKQLNRGKK